MCSDIRLVRVLPHHVAAAALSHLGALPCPAGTPLHLCLLRAPAGMQSLKKAIGSRGLTTSLSFTNQEMHHPVKIMYVPLLIMADVPNMLAIYRHQACSNIVSSRGYRGQLQMQKPPSNKRRVKMLVCWKRKCCEGKTSNRCGAASRSMLLAGRVSSDQPNNVPSHKGLRHEPAHAAVDGLLQGGVGHVGADGKDRGFPPLGCVFRHGEDSL
jgi:hypothetical protein